MLKTWENDIQQCLTVLQNGGIILYPTDTIWGIGCDATNTAAVKKIIALKQRHEQKSFIVLVDSEVALVTYVPNLDENIWHSIRQFTQPTTVIYPNTVGLASNVLAADGSVAIRVCRDNFCANLLRTFQKPIVSTSANISGIPYPTVFRDIRKEITSSVDYIVKYRQNSTLATTPSTIVRLENGQLHIVRK